MSLVTKKTFHINMLKKYNEREESVLASTNMAVENNGQFINSEESNNEAEGEEDVLGVICLQ